MAQAAQAILAGKDKPAVTVDAQALAVALAADDAFATKVAELTAAKVVDLLRDRLES
jgi:hypothetical protein